MALWSSKRKAAKHEKYQKLSSVDNEILIGEKVDSESSIERSSKNFTNPQSIDISDHKSSTDNVVSQKNQISSKRNSIISEVNPKNKSEKVEILSRKKDSLLKSLGSLDAPSKELLLFEGINEVLVDSNKQDPLIDDSKKQSLSSKLNRDLNKPDIDNENPEITKKDDTEKASTTPVKKKLEEKEEVKESDLVILDENYTISGKKASLHNSINLTQSIADIELISLDSGKNDTVSGVHTTVSSLTSLVNYFTTGKGESNDKYDIEFEEQSNDDEVITTIKSATAKLKKIEDLRERNGFSAEEYSNNYMKALYNFMTKIAAPTENPSQVKVTRIKTIENDFEMSVRAIKWKFQFCQVTIRIPTPTTLDILAIILGLLPILWIIQLLIVAFIFPDEAIREYIALGLLSTVIIEMPFIGLKALFFYIKPLRKYSKRPIISASTSPGMPSGHSLVSSSVLIWTILTLISRDSLSAYEKWELRITLGLAFLIPWSRYYNHDHTLLQIAVGWLCGLGVGIGFFYLIPLLLQADFILK